MCVCVYSKRDENKKHQVKEEILNCKYLKILFLHNFIPFLVCYAFLFCSTLIGISISSSIINFPCVSFIDSYIWYVIGIDRIHIEYGSQENVKRILVTKRAYLSIFLYSHVQSSSYFSIRFKLSSILKKEKSITI